ncbi:MAG: threonine synthase [Verrucomicrobiota bacterium]
MLYHSTRSSAEKVGFFEAFANGLAPDGGLYLPGELPGLPEAMLNPAAEYPYPNLAADFFGLFDTDHEPEVIRDLVVDSHRLFADPPNAAPLKQLDERLFVLELFHGPTLAFKDFGLQIVGSLFADQIQRTGKPINVLGATSGDTGSAAIHGLANQPGVNAFILYPKGRISPLQERQMTCTGAPNIFPISIEGSFDDAQKIVKDLFGDLEFKAGVGLSAINSINLARVLAQCIYYLHAWRSLPNAARSDVTFNVPTGNFGNIFAGWLISKMGLPVRRFRIATNQNDILYRLFTTGEYAPGGVDPSFAPSMDIQVASNFERFLFYALDGDASRVATMMGELKETGSGEDRRLRSGHVHSEPDR